MKKSRCVVFVVTLAAALVLMLAFATGAMAWGWHWFWGPPAPIVWGAPTTLSGEVTFESTTVYPWGLIIADDAVITAPEGKSLTLTANGVETGQKLVTTAGVDTALQPGTYFGRVVMTVADENLVPYEAMGPPPDGGGDPPPDGGGGPPPATVHYFPFRQAIYVDETGYVAAKSVPAAVPFGFVNNHLAWNIWVTSTGECFDAVYVAGGTYRVLSPHIKLIGNGRSDFVGYGAAIVGTGENTTLIVNGAKIYTRGVARPAIVADKGANVIVKNSLIHCYNGVLPDDYIPTIDTFQMRSVPWMLALSGNCRATNLLGTNTKASYINSTITAEGWGVLSTDGCTTPTLTAINSTIGITGKDGYGSYGIGNATEYFLGCKINVATYATISRGSFLHYGDSDRDLVSQLNTDLGLGLTDWELNCLPDRRTVVNSGRFGVMWHGGGTLDISGRTVFNTKEAVFLDKGQSISITVDGSEGAKLKPANGVLMQLMDDDDPGPVPPEMTNTGVYVEPTDPPVKSDTFDVTAPHAFEEGPMGFAGDAWATFDDIDLVGDFYNSVRGGMLAGPFGPPSDSSKNLVLTFNGSSITGVITSSTAQHALSPITADDYAYLGLVTNTPTPAVNNGVIVTLGDGATWVVTGTSYLTSLTIANTAALLAPEGMVVKMMVDGVETPVAPGTYTGVIELTIS